MFGPQCLNITLLTHRQVSCAPLLSRLDIKPVIVDCSAVGSFENEISIK